MLQTCSGIRSGFRNGENSAHAGGDLLEKDLRAWLPAWHSSCTRMRNSIMRVRVVTSVTLVMVFAEIFQWRIQCFSVYGPCTQCRRLPFPVRFIMRLQRVTVSCIDGMLLSVSALAHARTPRIFGTPSMWVACL